MSIDGMTVFKFALKNKTGLDASHRGWGIEANSCQHDVERSVFIRSEKLFAYRNKYAGFQKGFGVFELVISRVRNY
jgi:hypothetical protein